MGWSVGQVLDRLDMDRLYTSAGGEQAFVHPYECDCGFKTICTAPDDTTADNLDSLSAC